MNVTAPSSSPNAATTVEAPETLTGVIERIVFRSEDSGYTVCIVKPPGHKQPDGVTVVGTCGAIWPGETLTARGQWIRHKSHGFQFQAQRLECAAPSTAAGIQRYLASGLIKGIGDVLAGRLTAKFGDDTLRIIDRESVRLESVEGIGHKRRELIKASWNEQRASREIMMFLHRHGVSASQATRIYRQYGDDAIKIVTANPYRLAADIWGIGFKTADKIAMNLGIPEHSQTRARAGLVYAMNDWTHDGHCYCPVPELLAQAEPLLSIPTPILQNALTETLADQSLIEEPHGIYLPALYHAEIGTAEHLRRLMQAPAALPVPIDAARAVEWAQQKYRLTFAPEQINALIMAIEDKVSVITGGPGVGKTTIIRALVDVFTAKHLKVCLAAPTGRAAKRMEEATGRKAFTVHRLLKWLPGANTFEHHPQNPLDGHAFILDEMSMMDVALMNAFLRALPAGARLILVGDADQLPSVGPGKVLRDIIASGVIPTTHLTTIFRQKERSWIVHNAHRINQGLPLECPPPNVDSDFYFIEGDDPDTLVAQVTELICRRIPDRFGLNPRADVQLLTPMRRFQLGTDNLNAVLQAALNPTGKSITRFGRLFREGDRVMQLRNTYDKDVYNGDIGHIVTVDEIDQELVVDFDGHRVAYDAGDLDELTLAYAGTIHKSQGSEHPAVVITMTTQHYKLLQRNLLYTAITRGRKLVCLVGSKKAVQIAIHNNTVLNRMTGLQQRLTDRMRA